MYAAIKNSPLSYGSVENWGYWKVGSLIRIDKLSIAIYVYVSIFVDLAVVFLDLDILFVEIYVAELFIFVGALWFPHPDVDSESLLIIKLEINEGEGFDGE